MASGTQGQTLSFLYTGGKGNRKKIRLAAGVKLPVVSQVLVKLRWPTPSEEAVWQSVAKAVSFLVSVLLLLQCTSSRAAARHNKSMLLSVEIFIFFSDMRRK